MAIPISNVTRRTVYAPTGAGGIGPYAFTFEILANTDIAVFKDDTLLTLTTHYTVVINANGTGSVTITSAGLALAPVSPTQYAVVGNRTIARATDFTTGGDFFANTLNDELDQQTIFAQQNAEGVTRALQAPQTDPTTIDMTLPRSSVRAGKVLSFDASGNPSATEFIGSNRGNWATGTLYFVRDIVKDTSTSNIFQVTVEHTSVGAQPLTTNAEAAKYFLLVDAAAASASASAASTSASNASTSATNAASSASTASTQASNASTSASNASTSATSAAASAAAAATSASNAATSASNASTSASNASTSATNAATSATSAANSATAAATSATQAAASAASINLNSIDITGGTINGTSVGASTASTGAFTSLTATSGVVSANSTGDALRITQLGTGNALLVEDSTNPDATPFVIDATGNVVRGNATPLNTPGFNSATALTPALQSHGASTSGSAVAAFGWSATSSVAPQYILSRSRGASAGTFGVVSNEDNLGGLTFNGDDGTAFVRAATIVAQVDGTASTNDMPGRLILSTTPDGSDTPTERVRIDSAGRLRQFGDTILSNVNVIGASYDSVSFSVAGEELTAHSIFFSPDGLKMYVSGSTGDDVNEYSLSTAWVVSSAVFVTNFSVTSQDTAPQGLYFRADGTKMYVLGATNDAVFQYTLSTPWSVATATYENISFSVAGQETTVTGLFFKPNGLSMYMVGSTGDAVYQYTLSTAWNVSTATFIQSFSVSGQELTPADLSFTNDGSRMFVVGTTGDDVNVYNLTTPWNISTAAFVGVFSVSGQDTSPVGIFIKPDGTKMYIIGSSNDAVFQYTVPSIDIQLTGPTSVASLDVQQDLVVYGNTAGSFLNNGFRENIGGEYYNLVSQTDIGTAPNEIPLNQYLGANAYIDTETPALDVGAGITTGTGTICKANGGLSGGIYKVTIVIDLTGLNSGGTAGDIIGVNGTALPCYIAQLPAMTVLGGRMTCLELPAGGDTDIDLFSAAEGTGVEDQAITALTETQIINAGTQALGTVTVFSAYPTLNQYLYLVGQSTSNATYTAGRFLIEIFGVQ